MKILKVFTCAAVILAMCLSLAGCSILPDISFLRPSWTAEGSGAPQGKDGAPASGGEEAAESFETDPGGTGTAPQLSGAAAGDVILFGHYEQDNDPENGPEPIEWLVLTADGSRIFVVSLYALDCQPFDEDGNASGWRDCSLRSWLNAEFLNTAFTQEERNAIPTVDVPAGGNAYYQIDPDPRDNVRDRVFCLSEEEMHEYLDTDGDYHDTDPGYYCYSTLYAEAAGAATYPRDAPEEVAHFAGQCGYWLRNPSGEDLHAMTCTMGLISSFGLYYYITDSAVRPALWIIVG